MKLEIILAIAWTSLSIGERLPRSTVLTDESKRILEHFDFSNFDKQEALNNIERQRYEYQIRGKRSQAKLRSHLNGRNTEPISDTVVENNETPNEVEDNASLPPQILEKSDAKPLENTDSRNALPDDSCEKVMDLSEFAHQKPRRYGKKLKSANRDSSKVRSHDVYDEDEEERRLWKRRRKKRKRRRYWDHWTEWSPCSVTCGRGRKIRWRKCIAENCKMGELEMGEKTCQLPACSLINKLLGI